MNSKLKYSLIIISTLLIGMIIGFLVGGRITSKRIDRMRNYYTNQGFNRELMRIIEPTPEQRNIIIPILRKHAILNHEVVIDFHKSQEKLYTVLINDLKAHLDKEQLNRLSFILEKRKKRFQNTTPNHTRKDRRKRQFKE